MVRWFRSAALKRACDHLRAFECSATDEELNEFSRTLRRATAHVADRGGLRVDARTAERFSRDYRDRARQTQLYGRGARLAFQAASALLAYLSAGGTVRTDEVEFITALSAHEGR